MCLQENNYYRQLPATLQAQSLKYKFWEDQQRYILGKLLLFKALEIFNLSSETLNDIQYTKFGRPYIKSNFDFNISHSGEYAVLAIGKNVKLGIDIEKIIPVDFSSLKNTMSKKEWRFIYKSRSPNSAFFKLWTIKESVIKANNKEFSIPLHNIEINRDKIFCASETWFLKEIIIDQQYKTHLSSNKEIQDISIEYIKF